MRRRRILDMEEEEEEEKDNQPGPSRATSNQRAGENSVSNPLLPKVETLHVICGGQEGILHRGKFKNGEACIECGDEWLSPAKFEEKGGRGPSKKWRETVYCEGENLGFWLKQGEISTVGFHKRGTQPKKMKSGSSQDSSDDSSEESEMQSAGETEEEEDAEDEDWLPDSNELMAEMEEKRRLGAESEGGDSGEDKSEEEEETENGKLSGRETRMSRALTTYPLKDVDVVLKKLPVKDREKARSDSERKLKLSVEEQEDPATPPPADLSDPRVPSPISDDVSGVLKGEESEVELAKHNEGGEDGDRKIKTVAGGSSAPWKANINPEIQHHPAAKLTASPVLPATALNTSREEGGGSTPKIQISEVKSLYTKEATTSTCLPQAIKVETQKAVFQASSDTKPPDMNEGSSSEPHTNGCLDTLDLNELKREKLKIQIKVLRLQEEYYTLEIKKLKKGP